MSSVGLRLTELSPLLAISALSSFIEAKRFPPNELDGLILPLLPFLK